MVPLRSRELWLTTSALPTDTWLHCVQYMASTLAVRLLSSVCLHYSVLFSMSVLSVNKPNLSCCNDSNFYIILCLVYRNFLLQNVTPHKTTFTKKNNPVIYCTNNQSNIHQLKDSLLFPKPQNHFRFLNYNSEHATDVKHEECNRILLCSSDYSLFDQ